MAIALFFAVGCAKSPDAGDAVAPARVAYHRVDPILTANASEDGPLRVGAAREDISPREPAIMGGYGIYILSTALCRWSEGVHDTLWATAMYVEKGETGFVVIALDLVGLVAIDIDDIRRGVALQIGLPFEHVIVTSSHTHHSPDTAGLWGTILPPVSGRDESYMHMMKVGAIQAAVEAYDARVPATLSYAIGDQPDLHWNTYDALIDDATIDDTLTVVRADDANGAPIVTLVNWGCHPTTEGPQNRKASSDWVGAMRRELDKANVGLPIFVNGSIGASIQPSIAWRDARLGGEGQGFRWADALGGELAGQVVELSKSMKPAPVERIDIAQATLTVPMMNGTYRLARNLGLIGMPVPAIGEPYDTSVTAVVAGPLRFGTMPGEAAAHLGDAVRGSLGGKAQVLVGLGQDWLGYIIDPVQYENDLYAYERMLCFSPSLGVEMLGAYEEMGIARTFAWREDDGLKNEVED